MRVLYDTRTIHPLDRFEHYREGAARELAPVEVHGRAPGRLFATMSAGQIGDFDLEELTWTADAEITTRRTERLIRVSDPERYRLVLTMSGAIYLDQAGCRTVSRSGDIGLYDLALPWRAAHPPDAGRIRVAMLTFPRALLPVDERAVRSVIGSLMPRRMPSRDLMAKLLAGLTGAAEPADYADALTECTVGLIRHRLGLPHGITSRTRRMLHLTRIRDVIRAHFHEPDLDPHGIARAADISPRYLHKLFEHTDLTAMQLMKQMRLETCRRRLENPAQDATPVRRIAADCGYRRADQFARDFRQAFGVTPTQVRSTRTDEGSW